MGTLSQPPSPATPAPNQREKSAKLPRKSRPSKQNNNSFQSDKPVQKTAPKKRQIKPPKVPAAAHSAPASSLETQNSELETPHESLFTRLRRKWAKPKPGPAPDPTRDSEDLYQQHLQDLTAAGVDLGVGRESTRRAAAAQAPFAVPETSEAPPALPRETAAPATPQAAPPPEAGTPPPQTDSFISVPGPRSPVSGPSFPRPRSYPPAPHPLS